MIAGTSAGAVVGALYAQGKDVSRIRKLASDLRWIRLAPLADLTWPKTGLIGGKKIEDWLKSLFGSEAQISDLKIPFACVATDIMTGEQVVITEGPLVAAIRASMSIPGIFTVVNQEGRFLVDGGLVNPVPVSILKKMGADLTIGVNVLPDITARDRAYWIDTEETTDAKEPSIFHILMQSIYIGTHSLARTCLKAANIAIEPQVAHIGPNEFHRAEECILQGELATLASIAEIKKQVTA